MRAAGATSPLFPQEPKFLSPTAESPLAAGTAGGGIVRHRLRAGTVLSVLCAVGSACSPAFGDEGLPEPGKRATVTCAAAPAVKYDLYLPTGYAPDKGPFPVLITFSPGGGGMVGEFQAASEKLQVVLVGNQEYANGRDYTLIDGAASAVVRDLMDRVNLDPSAIFGAGMSGGGSYSYCFALRHEYLTAGLLPVAGWLGGKQRQTPWFEYVPDLLVMRLTGKQDEGAMSWLQSDKAFLEKYKVRVNDLPYDGGHVFPSQAVVEQGLKWLLDNRKKQPDDSKAKAQAAYDKWEAELGTLKPASVLAKCFGVCQRKPRSWSSLMAHKMIFKILREPARLQGLTARLGTGQAAGQFFGYIGNEAILTGDAETAQSALLCLQKVENLDAQWYARLIEVAGFGPPGRIATPALAESLGKCLSKSVEKEKKQDGYNEMMMAESLALQGKWKEAKRELAAVIKPANTDLYGKVKVHIESERNDSPGR